MQVQNLKYGLGGEVVFGRYVTGEISIEIVAESGERVAVATVNLDQWGADRAPEGHVYIKTWSENEGVLEALTAARVVEPPTMSIWGGYGQTCRAALCALTAAALAELKAQGGPDWTHGDGVSHRVHR